MIMLAGAVSVQAQTEKSDINTLARQYAKSNGNASLEIVDPQRVMITEFRGGFLIEAKGKHEGQVYKIKITHFTNGSSEINTTQTGRVDYDLKKGALFEDADRIVLTKSPYKNSIIVLKEGDNGYKLSIEQKSDTKENRTSYSYQQTSSSWDFNIPFKNAGKEKRSIYRPQSRFSFNLISDLEFGMGLVSAHSQAPDMDVEFGNAGWEFFLNNIFNWEYRPFNRTFVSLGFGVDWRNYRMKGENRFLKEDNKLTIAPYPDGADIDFSRVKVFSITLELMLRQNLNKNISIAAGPIVNFNTHASIKTRYTIGSGKAKEGFKETSSNIHQKPVTVDFKAEFCIDPIGFYFKYSPTNTLDTDFGPEFKSMSAGLVLRL